MSPEEIEIMMAERGREGRNEKSMAVVIVIFVLLIVACLTIFYVCLKNRGRICKKGRDTDSQAREEGRIPVSALDRTPVQAME